MKKCRKSSRGISAATFKRLSIRNLREISEVRIFGKTLKRISAKFPEKSPRGNS